MSYFLHPALYVFIISMLPLIELRGAVPIGAALGLDFLTNYPLAVIGNLLPVPFILLFIPKILDFMAGFRIFKPIVLWLRKKASKHSKRVLREADASEGGNVETKNDTHPSENEEKIHSSRSMSPAIFTGLLLFVALPIPGTGAWTGSLVAALFDLPKKASLLAIALGVMICGVIMCLASYGILGFLSFLL